MIAGGFFAGGAGVDGRIRDVRATPGWGEAAVSFRHEGVGTDAGYRYVIAVDGDVMAGTPRAPLAEGEGVVVPVMGGGEHRVSVGRLRPEWRHGVDLHGDPRGRHVFLRWGRSGAADCVGYRVFWDEGTGTVDTGTALAVVEGVTIEGRSKAGADSGSGSGRLSIGGNWIGGAFNGSVTVMIDGAGTFAHDAGDGEDGVAFSRGMARVLPGGIVVVFEDEPGTYDEGDAWVIGVGPRAEWNSARDSGVGALEDGTYLFRVAGVDAVGNVGTPGAAVAVVIAGGPAPVTGFAGSWDGAGRISLSWGESGAPDEVRIYSNHSLDFGRLTSGVIEDGAWATVAGGVGALNYSTDLVGEWRFYARTVKDGVEGESVEMVVVEVAGELPTGSGVNEPIGVRVEAIAGGFLRVRWSYRTAGGGSVEAFGIWGLDDPEGTPGADPDYTVLAGALVGDVREYSQDCGHYGEERWMLVRAGKKIGGVYKWTTNGGLVSGVPDDAGPGAVTGAEACSN